MNEQYGINVMSYDMYSMAAVSGATVSITGTIAWSGTTNATGYAKDIGGFSPTLPYGNYTVTVSKIGYNSANQVFTVPLAGNINITITKIYQTVEIIVSD